MCCSSIASERPPFVPGSRSTLHSWEPDSPNHVIFIFAGGMRQPGCPIGIEPRRRVRDWTVLRRVTRRAIQRRNPLAVDTALHGWIVRALRVALQRSVRHVAVDATRMQEHTLDLREGLDAGAPVRAGGHACGR